MTGPLPWRGSPDSGWLQGNDWIRLGLDIRPDGQVAVRVDGIPVGVHPLHLDAAGGGHWHLQVAGAAVDTELLVRDLVVWRGVP